MQLKNKILFSAFLVFLSGCNMKENQITIEEKTQQKLISELQKKDSSLIIRSYQGSFSILSTPNDTSAWYYSGFLIGYFLKIDSTDFSSNVQFNEDTISLYMKNNLIPNKFIGMKNVNFLKKFLIKKDSSDNVFLVDWENLKKEGYTRFITISPLMQDKKDSVGFVGIQTYTDNECDFMLNYVDFKDSISLKEIWNIKLNILDYTCIFDHDSLRSISPNSMILKSDVYLYHPKL